LAWLEIQNSTIALVT